MSDSPNFPKQETLKEDSSNNSCELDTAANNIEMGIDGKSIEPPKTNVSINNQPIDLSEVEEEGSQTLEEALDKFKISLPPKKIVLLKEYCELLWTWNERLNLTRHTTFDKFVSRDLVDSIQLANHLQKGEHVLDVGSGGGVPGLVVAILRPDVVVELCDATGKKAEALGAIVDELGLDVNIWYAKAEDLLRTRRFHTLTIRAVGKMRTLLMWFAPIWHTFDRILMIKGPNWLAERGEARHYNMFNTLALRKIDEYENPGADHGSVILQICKKSRIEEMERRAKEREAGLPYEGEIEDIVVDNRSNDRFEHSSHYNSKNSRVHKKRFRQDSGTNKVFESKRKNGKESDGSAKYGRSGFEKAPKGWTGKKSDFKRESRLDDRPVSPKFPKATKKNVKDRHSNNNSPNNSNYKSE